MNRRTNSQKKSSHSANPSSKKWTLGRDSIKFTSICSNSLDTNLYGSHTLAYWAEKDDTPKDPKRILWEESRLAMKRLSRAQRRIDTKLLCNHCGFKKNKFKRKYKILIHALCVMDLKKMKIIC